MAEAPPETPEQSVARQSDNIDKELSLVENEQLSIERSLLTITRRQLYTNVVLALSTAVLAFVTWQVSYSTYFLRVASTDQIRPYVFPTSISKSDTAEARITVKNVGVTPAFNLMVTGEGFFQQLTTGGRFNIVPVFSTDCGITEKTAGTPTQLPRRNSLGANETYSTFLAYIKTPTSLPSWKPELIDEFSKEQLESFRDGKSAYVIIGIICYQNLHGEWYYTRYCQTFHNKWPDNGPEQTKELIKEGYPCPAHNDAD